MSAGRLDRTLFGGRAQSDDGRAGESGCVPWPTPSQIHTRVTNSARLSRTLATAAHTAPSPAGEIFRLRNCRCVRGAWGARWKQAARNPSIEGPGIDAIEPLWTYQDDFRNGAQGRHNRRQRKWLWDENGTKGPSETRSITTASSGRSTSAGQAKPFQIEYRRARYWQPQERRPCARFRWRLETRHLRAAHPVLRI